MIAESYNCCSFEAVTAEKPVSGFLASFSSTKFSVNVADARTVQMQAEALRADCLAQLQQAMLTNGLQVDEGRAVWVSVQLVYGARRSRCGPASAPEVGSPGLPPLT